MADMKEKLIKLLGCCPCEGELPENGGCPDRKYGMCNEIYKVHYCALSNLADHLIANGVFVPTLCKECKHCKTIGVIKFCSRHHSEVKSDAFCSYGERRNDG